MLVSGFFRENLETLHWSFIRAKAIHVSHIEEAEDLHIDREVHREGTRPLLAVEGLDPIRLACNKPVCQQSW